MSSSYDTVNITQCDHHYRMKKIHQNTGCSLLLPHTVDASNTVIISSVKDSHLQPVITQLSSGSPLAKSNKMPAVVKDM